MTNAIHQGLPQRRVEAAQEPETPPNSPASQELVGFGKGKTPANGQARDLRNIGRELLKREQGEAFATHYHAAAEAAGALCGKEFLNQYRALKRIAQKQGMPEAEFLRFEKCLYRRFYQAAAQDTVRARQSGMTPRVAPHELAYIAKIADISEAQIRRDSLTFQKSEFVGRILALKGRKNDYAA